MRWTFRERRVTLINVCGKKFRLRKAETTKKQTLNYKVCNFGSTALGLGSGFEWWLCFILLPVLNSAVIASTYTT